ncbi:HEAT repeat domain-containing protein [Actinomadura violacea]|uniref:HEAT repeat domain-containing protein n=1 Tax=Actinomadura violacea TaxID=2819934 RepID=A0ABS3RRT6_9ACTN|nr:HEAT repeat domain-containing protein [Actinomadura violacea]MBO2459454.1 HEAT repeat domain-containing protein [Actinomadura violacea]
MTSVPESVRLAGLLDAGLPPGAPAAPPALDGPAEAALALARLHLHGHARSWPDWRSAGLPAAVRTAWLAAEIAAGRANVGDGPAGEPAGEPLYQAVRAVRAADADDPESLVRDLARRPDAVLRGEAVRIAREALHTALLPPRTVREVIAGLAAGVPEALRELAEPWAVLDPLPHERVRRLLGAGPDAAAIEVAARHGHRDLLRDVAADPSKAPASRRRALELLGDLAGRDDVGDLLAVAAQDPPLLAAPAAACLRGLHRRGHFPAARHVPAIIELALADQDVPAGEIAAVLFSLRHEALRELAEPGPGGADGGSWPRRLDLLVALDAQGAPGLDVSGAVARLARDAADPRPFLRALRDLRDPAAEETVLALLPDAPREALDALEAVGSPRTADALWTGLGLDGGDAAPHLTPFRRRALEILWHLDRAPGRRRTLLDRLDPLDLPRRIADDLGGPDPRELAVLRAAHDPADPAAALARLARNGDATSLPAVADLLLRVVSGLAAAWTPGGPGPDPAVPGDVLDAVRDLGGRLHRRGAVRPRCLLDAADPSAAGDALLASTVLDLLDRPGLVPAEQAVLLGVLRDAPYRRTRARVHPWLRHRDEHVRGRAAALFTTDAEGARVLSASLIPLTAADHAPTVRQALRALAEARAAWAAPAVAACLDHPEMSVKKTAAAALAAAGAPAAVPKMLFWLGRHDNPGLREDLVKALRAVLGDASAAVVLAEAEQAADDRTRVLLRAALPALAPSRCGAALGRLPESVGASEVERAAADVRSLAEHGWDIETARRVLDARAHGTGAPASLRPLLPRWLDLAASDPRALHLAADLCSPPWTPLELEIFAGSAALLVEALVSDGDGGARRRRLLELVKEAAPRLGAGERFQLTERVRALPPSTVSITVLGLCGAVVTRDDLERALAAARDVPDRAVDEEAVLREAFAQDRLEHATAAHEAIREAVREPGELRRLRAGLRGPSRDVLDALISAFPDAPADARPLLLDWMEAVQPLGAPPWTLAEDREEPEARTPRAGDLDQPPSVAQRRRLMAMLDAGPAARRAAAARALLARPEPAGRAAVLRAYLEGRAGLTATRELAHVLLEAPEPAETFEAAGDERFVRLAGHLYGAEIDRFVPVLVARWERGDGEARRVLRQASGDTVAGVIAERLADGAWGLLDLIAGRKVVRTAALDRALRRLRDEGRDDLAARLVLVDAPLRAPGAAGRDAAALAAMREHKPPAVGGPSRAVLFRQARDGGAKEARRALALLADRREEGLDELLAELIGHRETKVRLHAHRVSRRVLGRAAYLDQTVRLLGDPEPDVVRSAVRTLSHAAWAPAIPGLVGLLAHPRAQVRQAAADGLVRFGAAAVPALRHAAGRARPDHRSRYTAPLARINGSGHDGQEAAKEDDQA